MNDIKCFHCNENVVDNPKSNTHDYPEQSYYCEKCQMDVITCASCNATSCDWWYDHGELWDNWYDCKKCDQVFCQGCYLDIHKESCRANLRANFEMAKSCYKCDKDGPLFTTGNCTYCNGYACMKHKPIMKGCWKSPHIFNKKCYVCQECIKTKKGGYCKALGCDCGNESPENKERVEKSPVILFGKYSGKRVIYLLKEDVKYLRWLRQVYKRCQSDYRKSELKPFEIKLYEDYPSVFLEASLICPEDSEIFEKQ